MSSATPIPGSRPVKNAKLSLFDIPNTDVSVLNRRYVKIQPFTTGITPVDFRVQAQSGYCDLSRSYLEVELKLKKSDGTRLSAAATSQIMPANNLAHTMIKQCNVRLGDTLISPQTDTYAYKSYFETVLHHTRQEGKDVLQTQGWFNGLDPPEALTANQLDSGTPHADYTALPQHRKDYIADGRKEIAKLRDKSRFYKFKPFNEVFYMSKLLVPGVPLNIQLFFHNPNFFMVRHRGTDVCRLQKEDVTVSFMLCTVTLLPSLERELALKQTKSPVSYPLVRGEMRTYTLGTNDRNLEINNPFNDRIPNLVVIGMVTSNAYNGTVTSQPFRFQTFNLSSIQQFVRGEAYPYQTLELKHDANDRDILGYWRFAEATGSLNGKRNMMLPEEWGRGKGGTLFAFDNTANGLLNSAVLNPKLNGELRYVLNFGAVPGSNATVLVYGEFEELLEIDSNRVVLYNLFESPGRVQRQLG